MITWRWPAFIRRWFPSKKDTGPLTGDYQSDDLDQAMVCRSMTPEVVHALYFHAPNLNARIRSVQQNYNWIAKHQSHPLVKKVIKHWTAWCQRLHAACFNKKGGPRATAKERTLYRKLRKENM